MSPKLKKLLANAELALDTLSTSEDPTRREACASLLAFTAKKISELVKKEDAK